MGLFPSINGKYYTLFCFGDGLYKLSKNKFVLAVVKFLMKFIMFFICYYIPRHCHWALLMQKKRDTSRNIKNKSKEMNLIMRKRIEKDFPPNSHTISI